MNTTTRRIGAVTAVAAVLIAGLWYMFLFRPETHKLSQAHKAHAAAEAQAATLRTQLSQLDSWVKLIPADTKRLSVLKTMLPDNPQLAEAMDTLRTAESRSGLQIKTFDPTPPGTPAPGTSPSAKSSGPASISVTMTALGSYQQSIAFLTYLDSAPRVWVVDHLSLASASNSSNLSVQISARIFYAGQPTP